KCSRPSTTTRGSKTTTPVEPSTAATLLHRPVHLLLGRVLLGGHVVDPILQLQERLEQAVRALGLPRDGGDPALGHPLLGVAERRAHGRVEGLAHALPA